MPQLAGTSNEDSLVLANTLTVSGAATFSGATTFSGTPTLSVGQLQPVQRFIAAGTVTLVSGFVDFNVSAAGFAVRLPAPVAGAEFTISCHIVPSSGLNTITIPSGGTIYQQASTGTVLSFGTAGQAVRVIGLNTTQYQIVSNLGTVTLS